MAVSPDGVRGAAGGGRQRDPVRLARTAAKRRWAIVEEACVEDYGGFGEWARQVLRFIAEAAFGEPPSAVKDLFMWRAPNTSRCRAQAIYLSK